jgi:hypothetical protein
MIDLMNKGLCTEARDQWPDDRGMNMGLKRGGTRDVKRGKRKEG